MKNKNNTHILAIVAILFLLALSLQAISAADIIVTNDTDAGGIKSGLDQVTDNDNVILLATGNYTGENNTGLNISKSVTIRGDDSPGNVIINAGSQRRIFTINDNYLTIIFENITFLNGKVTNDNGGAINNIYTESTMTFINCIFINNVVTTGNVNGSAIYNLGENLKITNCNFTSNSMQATAAPLYATGLGGAIYNSGANCNITNCNFDDNKITSGYYGRGGAIYNTGANLTMDNCNFNNNYLYGYSTEGGAIYNSGANCNITNCNFTDNNPSGQNSGGIIRGGAICNFGVNFTVDICDFTNNSVSSGTDSRSGGGAIYNGGSNANITDSNFTNNSANYGGAIRNDAIPSIINNCNFINNSASTGNNYGNNRGGAIYCFNEWTWDFYDEYSIINCNFTNNSAYQGGAIYGYRSKVNINNNDFINNSADYAAGAIYAYSGDFNISNNDFINNSATYGGAIYNLGEHAVINCNFTTNNASSGGAIYSVNEWYNGFYDENTIINCNFNNNNASNGGAIYNSGNTIISDSNFNNNLANSGGAIYIPLAQYWGDTYSLYGHFMYYYANINNCNFTDNNATIGGAINVRGNATITDSNFIDNIATDNIGGGIFTNFNSTIDIFACNFTGNNQPIYLNGTNITISACNIIENLLSIIIDSGSSNVTIQYNRIFNNTYSNDVDLINYASDTNADYNWWGFNTPLVSGISLNNYFIMVLAADSYQSIFNETINDCAVGVYNLSYRLLLFNISSEDFQVVDYGVLPDFLINLTWKNKTDDVINSLTDVNDKGEYSYLVNLGKNGLYSIEALGDNEDLILTINGEIQIPAYSTIDVDDVYVGDIAVISGVATSDIGALGEIEVTITINGETFTNTTDINGNWVFYYPTTESGEDIIVTVSWVCDDESYYGFTNSTTFNIYKLNTSTTIDVLDAVKIPALNETGATFNVTGVLTNQRGQPVGGVNITVSVDGKNTTVITEDNGSWSVEYTPTHNGTIAVIASFAGDDKYNSCENSSSFTVTKGKIIVIITLTNNPDGSVTITANVTTDDGDYVPDYVVEFYKDGIYVGTNKTNATGIATITLYPEDEDEHEYTVVVPGLEIDEEKSIATVNHIAEVIPETPEDDGGNDSPDADEPEESEDPEGETNVSSVGAAMKNTGMPIIAVILVLLSSLGLIIRRK